GDVAISPPLEPIVVIGEEDCEDGIDNNGDGRIDCDDVRCAQKEICQESPEPSGAVPSSPECPTEGVLDVKMKAGINRGEGTVLDQGSTHLTVDGTQGLSVTFWPLVGEIRAPRDDRYHYEWNWVVDGEVRDSASSRVAPSFYFTAAERKTLRLRVTDSGCSSNGSSLSGTASAEVIIMPVPQDGGGQPGGGQPQPEESSPNAPEEQAQINPEVLIPEVLNNPAPALVYTNNKPEWEKFRMGIVAKQLTVASGDNLAVVVALSTDSKRVYYRLFDLQNRRFLSDWRAFTILSRVMCAGRQPASFDKLSAAISKDGEKFVVAMEKECGSGGSNVFYQMFTRWSGRSDGSYVEGAPQYMGQRGNKWAPVVMRNSRNDFAIAWLFEEKNETITSSTRRVFGYRIRYRVQKAYFKIIKANGVTTVGPSRFVDTWWRGG
ncbi:MAG: hypothetical protein U1D33_03110, partial [bacterium]|nr:hypothetical protein [bacterium]